MKKFILALVTVVSIFSTTPAVAFDWENSVFKPLMIYGVYEEEEHVILRSESDEGSQTPVIPSEHVILSSNPRELRLEESETKDLNEDVSEPVIPSEVEESLYNRQLPLNPFSIFLSIGKIQDSAFKYKDAILELKEKLWHPPKDPSIVTLDYWNSLTEKQQKELHYYRNEYQKDLPYNILWPKSEFPYIGNWLCRGEPLTHNLNGATGNRDCRGWWLNKHKQAIYDKDGILVTTPDNMGTYDFYDPKFHLLKHQLIDVKPWIEWGNSPGDPTTKEDRINNMRKSFTNKIGLYYLGYLSLKEVFERQ